MCNSLFAGIGMYHPLQSCTYTTDVMYVQIWLYRHTEDTGHLNTGTGAHTYIYVHQCVKINVYVCFYI